MHAATDAPRIGVEGVSRRYGHVVANDDVTFGVQPGTIHGVVGENGAGKSTLMRMLYGLDRPDAGRIIIDGRQVRLRGPADGLANGIGIVQQEFALVPELTLLENLVLGAEPRRGVLIDWARARERATELAGSVGLELDWDVPAAQAPVSIQQQLEILRLLYRGADVLILDEPTAVLAPDQVRDLLRLLRDLRDSKHTVAFISHKLDEVLAVADNITVMRDGRIIRTLPAVGIDPDDLAELVVGEPVNAMGYVAARRVRDTILQVRDLTAADDRGNRRLAGINLTVRAGEIVGVAGVAGNGQDELVECIVGLRISRSGSVTIGGADLTNAPVLQRRAMGLAYVSADRGREGLALDASLVDNVIAGFHRGRLSRRGWLPPRLVARFVRRVLRSFSIRHLMSTDHVRTLSGGNQQRLVVGRELSHEPTVLIAAQPTRGVDVKGIMYVHERLRKLRDDGAGVLLVSEELDELLALSDRVVAVYRGAVVGEVPGGSDRAELGRLMLGRTA